MIFGWIRELVGHPGEIANKARLYDRLVESGDQISARQTIPILVRYLRMMNNLFADIQKVVPPSGIPRRVLYQGPPGSPTGTLYEEVGKVAIVADPPTTAELSQQAGGSRPGSSGKVPERARSSQARRKSTGSVRTGRGQSLGPRIDPEFRTGPGPPSATRLRTGRLLRIGVSPRHIRPLPPFQRIARWRSQLLLHHLGRPLPETRELLRVGSTRSN